MTKFSSENPDPRYRFKTEEEELDLDYILQFIKQIQGCEFNASNPKAREILEKFPHKLKEYLIEIQNIKKDEDKEKENPNETPQQKEKRKKENSERGNKIAQELFIIACASNMKLDDALEFHKNCGFGPKELSQFGENGLSPLAAMMLSDKSPDEMQKVINMGANINEKSPSGMTVTDLAVLVGNEKMAETLKENGGKLNLISKEIARGTEAEEEREKGRGLSKQQERQKAVPINKGAYESGKKAAEEQIQQQQIARQIQAAIARKAIELHEESREQLSKKKQELQKTKEESDTKLKEIQQQIAEPKTAIPQTMSPPEAKKIQEESRAELLKKEQESQKTKEKPQNTEIFKERQLKPEEEKIEKPLISELEKILGIKLPDLNINELLFDAVRNGQQTMALLLVGFGGNVNYKKDGKSVLDEAVAKGNNSLISTLLTSSSPDTVKKAFETANVNEKMQKLLKGLTNEQRKVEPKTSLQEVENKALSGKNAKIGEEKVAVILLNKKVSEQDLKNIIPNKSKVPEVVVEQGLRSRVKEKITNDESKFQVASPPKFLDPKNSENAIITKSSPIPENELPILERHNSKDGNKNSKTGVAPIPKSNKILSSSESPKTESQEQQKNKFESPLLAPNKEFNGITPPKPREELSTKKSERIEDTTKTSFDPPPPKAPSASPAPSSANKLGGGNLVLGHN